MRSRLCASAAALVCAACAGVQDTPAPRDETPVAVTPKIAPAPPVAVAPPPTPKIERPPAPPPEPKVSELDQLFAEFERLRRLPAAEIPREQEAARQSFNQSRSDAARIRLAIASTLPGSAPGEDVRALELLEPLVKNSGSPLHGLAFLLSTFIQEQRRLAGLVQGLQQNNQTLQQNVHALQQKLDALRTLERALTERGEPAQRRR